MAKLLHEVVVSTGDKDTLAYLQTGAWTDRPGETKVMVLSPAKMDVVERLLQKLAAEGVIADKATPTWVKPVGGTAGMLALGKDTLEKLQIAQAVAQPVPSHISQHPARRR